MSNYLITIDPGLRGLGLAVFKDQLLFDARYVRNPDEGGRGYAAHRALAQAALAKMLKNRAGSEPLHGSTLIIEMPRVYPGMPKTDLNDLLDLSGVGGAVASEMACVFGVGIDHAFPSDWKGQLEKKAMVERIKSKLLPVEVPCVEKAQASLMHNVYDAIGIGLWKLGRLNKKVYPGIEDGS